MEDFAANNPAYLARINGSVNADKAKLMQMRNLGDSDQALRMAANEFAGVFMSQMYKIMDSTVQRSGMFGGGQGENVFREMLNQEYARNAAYGDAYGLGEMIYQAMKVRASATPPAAPAPAGDAAVAGKPKEE